MASTRSPTPPSSTRRRRRRASCASGCSRPATSGARRRSDTPSFREQTDTLASWQRFPGVERVEPPRVALTFDDGPDPVDTPPVLDALDAAGVKATFFVVGEQLARHHAVAREAKARGHQLALHGATHPRHADLSPQAARDEVARGVGAFEVAVGQRPRLFRPPYGRFSEHSHEACLKLGLKPVYWSCWGLDWEPVPAARIADLVLRDLEPGAVVILHDSARYAPRGDCAATVESIPLIAAAARERGLELGPLGDPPDGG